MSDLAKYGLIPQLPEAFDHQVTGTYGECERMGYYKHILGRVRTSGDRTALEWGKTFHDLTEIWDTSDGDISAIHEHISNSLSENEEDRYGRTQGRMYSAFTNWLQFRQLNPIEILRTEQPVLIRCMDGQSCPYFEQGCGLEYGGRMDRIVRWDAMIGPLDFKTTVMDEQDPISEYRPNHQFEGYVWAASHLLGEHCWGIIVERIVTNKSKIDVRRFPVSFTRDQIREWVENEKRLQSRILKQFQESSTDELAWVQNYFRCSKPWPCEFRDACLSSRDMDFRYRWLRDNTIEKRWDFRNPDGKLPAPVEAAL